MGKWGWYVNRLRAMGPREVAWRLGQKYTEQRERRFAHHPTAVTAHVFDGHLRHLSFNARHLGLSFEPKSHTHRQTIHLLGDYDYQAYATRWHSGFQTSAEWPRVFAYDLDYKQNDRIGDARTNWELNRHFQWALWAKNYYHTRDEQLKETLRGQWEDWCKANPFLIGISWTSVMEVAIRAVNWMVMLAYMQAAGDTDPDWEKSVSTGIINMLSHVARHRSRFSSANNHLLVESAALVIGGYTFDHNPWKEESIQTMTRELSRQTTDDGVNREMSLHYHAFVLEAYALTAHCILANHDAVPDSWMAMMRKMCEFVCHSSIDGLAIAFGDDDEGKIIDLNGDAFSYLDYVLQLGSLVTGQRFSPFTVVNDTVRCLFDEAAIHAVRALPLFDAGEGRCFCQGGYTFLRSHDGDMLIGIDHAPLGFGSIAAHGHADALSFQLIAGGHPLFTDPGTFIYHCDIEARNAFRKTIHHNTLCLGGADQSEMLGAFLWGRKAQCRLLHCGRQGSHTILSAEHDGYAPIIHRRTFDFDHATKTLVITDLLSQDGDATLTFMVGGDAAISPETDGYRITAGETVCHLTFSPAASLTTSVEPDVLSPAYGIRQASQAIRCRCHGRSVTTTITIRSSQPLSPCNEKY